MNEQPPDANNTRQSRSKRDRSPLLDLPLDEGPRQRKHARPLFQTQRQANLRATRAWGKHVPSWFSPIVTGVLDYLSWVFRDLPAFIQRSSSHQPAAGPNRPAQHPQQPTTRPQHHTRPEQPADAIPAASVEVIAPASEAAEAEKNTLTARRVQADSTTPVYTPARKPPDRQPGHTDRLERDEHQRIHHVAPAHNKSAPRPPATPRKPGASTTRPVARPRHTTTQTSRARAEDSGSADLMMHFERAFAALDAEGLNIGRLAHKARRINADIFSDSVGMPFPGTSQLSGFLQQYKIIILLAVVLFAYIFTPDNPVRPTGWDGPSNFVVETVQQTLGISTLPERPVGDYHLEAAPSLTARQVDAILTSYGSPAAGTGNDWVEPGHEYGIDPAFAVAFFIHESTAGTNPGWAGIKADGTTTHNVGNIICAGYPTCYGRFRDYPSWRAGIEDWYRLIRVEYLDGRDHKVVGDIIPVYAPAFENDVDGYRRAVEQMVDSWKQGHIP